MRSALLLLSLLAACTAPSGEDDKDPVDTDLEDTGDSAPPVDADQDGSVVGDDCDDADADVNPSASELCDGIDNNCDGDIDEDSATDALTWYGDTDGDGAGDAEDVRRACTQPATYLPTATDCDDADPANFPGNVEICDGGDNDCDTEVDEDAADAPTWYADDDGDGFGDPDADTVACESPAGHVSDGTDCADDDATAYVGAPEACDGVDHDCDGAVNEDTSVDVRTWYADADRDGYGSPDFTTESCLLPDGYASTDTDCDDGDAATYVGAVEVCDEVDNDCDGAVDDGAGACDGGGGGGAFDGTFASSWETLESSLTNLYSLQSFHSSGTLLYNMYPDVGQAYDPATNTWTYLGSSAPSYRIWNSMAPYGGQLYGVFNSGVYRYTPADDRWETLAAVSYTDDYGMTEVDEDGNVYGHLSEGYLVVYDPADGSLDYVYTGLGEQYETRMGYDPTTRGLYFGGFGNPYLYRYDLDDGSFSAMTDIPEYQLNDIFCSDRSGHIYAAGGDSGTTMWQYTTATDTWSALPDLPSDHGNNYTCTVSEDGWLYVGAESNAFYRLELY